MLKDSKFSSHLLHLSQLQIINHKTLDEYRERLKTFEVKLFFCLDFAIENSSSDLGLSLVRKIRSIISN